MTKGILMESQKFSKLHTLWRKVYEDLAKIQLTSQLNNPYAIRDFLAKFPFDCQISYINYREVSENREKRLSLVINE